MNNTIKISKILSLILRHKPEKAGIILDNNGWTNVEDLLAKFSKTFFPLSKEQLSEVVEKDNKQRYSFNSDKSMIRANQGHSIEVDLNLKVVDPPEFLYHGTVEKFIASIKSEGIKKGNRQYVHLSADTETASKVGQRRGRPVILIIHAEQMHQAGYSFFLSENKVWLTDFVPAKFINL